MRAVHTLPEDYKEFCSIHLQKDKKLAVLINTLAAVIAVAMVLIMHYFHSVLDLFAIGDDVVQSLKYLLIRMLTLLGLIAVYMILHELVHGMAMKICGTKKVKYGFTGLYAFAGSDDYYGKGSYLFIALAPVVLWGVVLAVVNCFVPAEWFWVVYLVQVINISGAAGDLYVTIRFSRLPKDILVKDVGVGMTVYTKE